MWYCMWRKKDEQFDLNDVREILDITNYVHHILYAVHSVSLFNILHPCLLFCYKMLHDNDVSFARSVTPIIVRVSTHLTQVIFDILTVSLLWLQHS